MQKDELAKRIEELIRTMGLAVERVSTVEVAGQTLFTVETPDSAKLIGTRGDTLSALNHLVKKTLESSAQPDDAFKFMVDVNGYHLKHIRSLEAQASMLAERARTFKYDVEMSPMSSYERMIVHAALSGMPDIKTESQGEGHTRHVVVKYVGGTMSAPPQSAVPL